MMNETEFNLAVDTILRAIEDAVDALDTDIDVETSTGILTLTFENHSQIIVNRQNATREIWVAARSGGFHCGYQGNDWVCRKTGETLPALLSRVCSEQAGVALAIPC